MKRNNSTEIQSGEPSSDNKGLSNTKKDPDEWTTGNEAMTGAQHSYLKTLSDEADEEMDGSLTKAEASKRIEELQRKTGRGLENTSDKKKREAKE